MKGRAILTVDLGYGDAGKGSVIDWLAREYNASLVVRYNGGCQAAHNVVLKDRTHHTFAQFGSGTFAGAATFLSRFMLIAPDNFLAEEEHLRKCDLPFVASRVIVDKRAPITTPFHRAANRLKEIIRAEGRHGSCGEGIGETTMDIMKYGKNMLYAGDILDRTILREKLRFLRSAKLLELEEELDIKKRLPENKSLQNAFHVFHDYDSIERIVCMYEEFASRVRMDDGSYLADELEFGETVLFEGAQGVLLDQSYGFLPYATWTNTTLQNAETLLEEAGFSGEKYRLGITRAYGVRHGAGPFVTEDENIRKKIPELHNGTNPWQREFRAGWFDGVATRYALNVVGGVDGIAVTCLDHFRLEPSAYFAKNYEYIGKNSSTELKPFFTSIGKMFPYTNAVLQDISVMRPHNRTHQFELTRHLLDCKPAYTGLAADTDGIMEMIGDICKTPIVAASSGPISDDKRFIGRPFMKRRKKR